MVAKNYLQAMLSRRTAFKEDYGKIADKVIAETKKLQLLFTNIKNESEDPFEAILMLSEVIRCDKEMIVLELHKIVSKYHDITEDHILRLLSLRGDISRADAKDIGHIEQQTVGYTSSIFATLVFPRLGNLNIPFK